jgi:hypothetical protein
MKSIMREDWVQIFSRSNHFVSKALHASITIVSRHGCGLDVEHVAHRDRDRAGGRTAELAEGSIPSSPNGIS